MTINKSLINQSRLLSISKTETSWKKIYLSSSLLNLEESSYTSFIPAEVQELVQKLAEVEGVNRVRAVAPRAIDIHWIEFELEVQPEIELTDESWDKIQNLVIDYDWSLREKSDEKWYFHAEIVEKFRKIKEGARVVTASYIQSLKSSKNKNLSYTTSSLKLFEICLDEIESKFSLYY